MTDSQTMSRRQHVRDALELLRRHLQIAHAGIVVAAAALRHQNVERDEEVARVLIHCVGQRVFEQIEQAEALVAALQPANAGSQGGGGDRDGAG